MSMFACVACVQVYECGPTDEDNVSTLEIFSSVVVRFCLLVLRLSLLLPWNLWMKVGLWTSGMCLSAPLQCWHTGVLAWWHAGVLASQMHRCSCYLSSRDQTRGPPAPKASSLLMQPAQSQNPHLNCLWMVDMHMILKVAAMKNF